VQHLECKNYNAVLNKAGAVLVLQAALGMATGHLQQQDTGSPNTTAGTPSRHGQQ